MYMKISHLFCVSRLQQRVIQTLRVFPYLLNRSWNPSIGGRKERDSSCSADHRQELAQENSLTPLTILMMLLSKSKFWDGKGSGAWGIWGMLEKGERLRKEILVADNISLDCVPSGLRIWNVTISQHVFTLFVVQPGLHCTQFWARYRERHEIECMMHMPSALWGLQSFWVHSTLSSKTALKDWTVCYLFPYSFIWHIFIETLLSRKYFTGI